MSRNHLRRRIAWEAARLMFARDESEYFRAKSRAARRLCRREVEPVDLPNKREIRDQIRALAWRHQGRREGETLYAMRAAALGLMRTLWMFRPRLTGDVLAGDASQRATVELHVFSDNTDAVGEVLRSAGIDHQVRPSESRQPDGPSGHARILAHFRFPFELTVCPSDTAHRALRDPATGEAIDAAGIPELTRLVKRHSQESPVRPSGPGDGNALDRFQVYRLLLLPLENVAQDIQIHPEGDALYHSLQVFTLAREHRPYDEEFLLAALLHDVGKAIDTRAHAAAALEALGAHITPRTAWLIEHHAEAHALRNRTLGVRSRRRLEASDDFDDLVLLAECDSRGRAMGATVPDVDEALESVRELADACGEETHRGPVKE